MNEQDFNELHNALAEIKVVEYFKSNAIRSDGRYYINYPLSFPFPLEADTEDALFEMFIGQLSQAPSA